MDQVIKITDDSGHERSIAFGTEEEVAAFVVATGFIKAIEDQTGRWRGLASATPDRELSGYYRDKAVKSEAQAARYRQLAEDGITPAQARNVSKQVAMLHGNSQTARKAVNPNQVMKPVDDRLANETARRGILAQVEAAENEAREHDRRADESMNAVRRVNDRELINHYSEKARDHRAHAELCRARADAHRRAAQAF